jgi:hypothetical protein
MTEYRIPGRVALFFSTLLLSSALSGQPVIDEALLTAARSVIPSDLNENEIRAVLETGLWHDDSSAVAISIPRQNEYMTFVFRRQPDGALSAADVSWVANTVFGAWGFPRDDIERFETKPVRWQSGNRGNLLLWIQTRGWRKGQRYTGTDVYLVFPDGTLTNR